MSTIKDVTIAKLSFSNEFRNEIINAGNSLSVGIGVDPDSGYYTIEARLNNDKLKHILPQTYNGFKVNILVVGDIVSR